MAAESNRNLQKNWDLTFRWIGQRYPGMFEPGQLRTLQRRVREWRLKLTLKPLESDVNIDHRNPQGEDP